MFNAVNEHFFTSNIFISAAAVADYKPEKQVSDKIKKSDERFTLSLTKNKDILKHFGNLKKENQIVVGFALETSNEKENALSKLKSKNADMIVLNSLNDKGAGFQSDTNKISILLKNGDVKQFQLKNKTEVAKDILNEIISQLKR
jgi:phosphopantothenoylcysteine decarboxylase/phosphopantothenate--cysteine ligase